MNTKEKIFDNNNNNDDNSNDNDDNNNNRIKCVTFILFNYSH